MPTSDIKLLPVNTEILGHLRDHFGTNTIFSERGHKWDVEIKVIWKDVEADGGDERAETDLRGKNKAGLKEIWAMMKQRGWRDYVEVKYEEK